MKIVIGLGNPGQKYERTRHNAGWVALDLLAGKLNLNWSEDKSFQALLARGNGWILVKPLTFMNNSGQAAQKIIHYYHPRLTAEADLSAEVIVIHDDLDLPLGTYKYAINGGSAGHRGDQSLIDLLKTKNFGRYRLGIRTDNLDKAWLGIFKHNPAKFVLARFPAGEYEALKKVATEVINQISLN